ncbi:hypothetical protein AK830_g3847 [Neonectria ditissima]|uniref:Zn(2)-C6 fungal-type domain-containing protein n=1 Tax=Neonectria ditissima TaxID=78410 RepID=A0A0P7BQ80_9HYPO|nr:hypothetical protein AK830_g3847 [Neonectria ditissima]
MTPRPTNGQARASCSRCHKRKKRCDRALPQCDNCRRAFVACSFLNDDGQTASYPIAYVRHLENRVKELEKSLSPASRAPTPPTHGDQSPGSSRSIQEPSPSNDEVILLDQTAVNYAPIDTADMDWGVLGSPATADSANYPRPEILSSLDVELKNLSLEAAAERHLGSTSGLSFAKLTQTVLRRLNPDKADFVFGKENECEDQQLNLSSLSSLLTCPVFLHFGNSVSCDPMLFGDFPLANMVETDDDLAHLLLPSDHSKIDRLVGFYFAHSHTLYPIIQRTEFNTTLRFVRDNPQASSAQSPLSLFRIWMVLAIGSTAYCSVSLAEESESMLYYSKAMTYFEASLGYGDMVALEVIMLQVSYSFFNQLGPNTWFLVGIAARIALGMGLHTSSTYEGLPTDIAERRKRLFFSVYMMDRVVSTALGRPFALHEDDIDVSPFADIDEENITADGIQPRSSLQPGLLAVPLHILALRRIASKIAKQVYSNPRVSSLGIEEREAIVSSIHQELVDWRRNMPFPLPNVNAHVPHLTSNWYDFNYYTHLAMLYRPTPLLPTLDQRRIKILADAASMSLRQATNMHRQQVFAYNWLNLLAIFTATLSLVYAITAQPDNLFTVLKQTKATEDLELVMELFDTLSEKFSAAKNLRKMVSEIVREYHHIEGSE